MYKTGVLPGKFLPPHRGHLNAIIQAATQCELLYVVVSDHPQLTQQLCAASGLPIMDLKLRTKWLAQELQGLNHIQVIMLDETGIPLYPYGWEAWSAKLQALIPAPIEVIFGGEPEYQQFNERYLPEVVYQLFDVERTQYPISATAIRQNPFLHWEVILGSARQFFAKKVLIAGTESCGKTTLTKYLGKIYDTSWAEEEGRHYSTRYLGGNEKVFTLEDFGRIAFQQAEADRQALQQANKVVFYDSDAVITQLYCQLYLGVTSPIVAKLIDPQRYDLVLLFTPDVAWVPDGLRWVSDTAQRWDLHHQLKQMYLDYGFTDKLLEISGNYQERLTKSRTIVDQLLAGIPIALSKNTKQE